MASGSDGTITLDGLVAQIRDAYGANLVGIVLYGSAAGADYRGPASDQNVLVLVDDANIAVLRSASRVVRAWSDAGNPPPLVLTVSEWIARADVFAIEYADLLARHRVLHGSFPIDGVLVNADDLRRQIEFEAMGKLLRLRRGLMYAGQDTTRVRSLLDDAFSGLFALLRATMYLHGESVPDTSEALCERVGALAGFAPGPLRAVLEHRRGTTPLGDAALESVAQGYYQALEQLVAHVDAFAVTP